MNRRSTFASNNFTATVLATVLSFFSIAAFAGTAQLDILGLVPSVSTLTQIKNAGKHPNSSDNDSVTLKIGGIEIPCAVELLNDKLATLTCLTGQMSDTAELYTEESNIRVHLTLTNGFTKKFGKPNSVIKIPMRTRIGVTHIQETVEWKDKRGNKLQLISMASSISMGMITFESSEYLKQEAVKDAAEDKKKKF